jgi:hypothetical protein
MFHVPHFGLVHFRIGWVRLYASRVNLAKRGCGVVGLAP